VAERHQEVRGDELLWLTPEACPLAWRFMQTGLETARCAVNAATLLGLHELEAHYAAYPPGAGYLKHLDRFRDDDHRVISMVLYLNEGWGAEDGGELLLYPESGEQAVKLVPRGGNLVCFLSDRVPHEVLPARRLRLSLTGWFRKRS
jgi:SM-20-related protein